MAKYKINHQEITGKKGNPMYKNQIHDESKFVDGSIEYLKSIGAIEASEVEEIEEKAKKPAKKSDKPE